MKQYECDILIVGTGIAGLYTALHLPIHYNIHIVTKKSIQDSNSYLAQGGICVLKTDSDYESFVSDTMRAGHQENNLQAVEMMVGESTKIIKHLVELGVNFEKDVTGNYIYTKEGGHSTHRILHHQDATGKEIMTQLFKQIQARSNIQIQEYTTIVDLLTNQNHCYGGVVAFADGEQAEICSKYTVLCTGGIGGMYEHTTNFTHITGDAITLAKEHQIELQNIDWVQFHPTTLYTTEIGQSFLISEAVRGEGAILLNQSGERFTDELKPRDIVSKAILKQMEEDKTEYVMLDMRPIGAEKILKQFPNIYNRCLQQGTDVLKEPIAVVPAQHYHMGGLKVDLSSKTSMNRLYACGEASCNGVHGKNRLASNSILESLVFAKRCAEDIFYDDIKQIGSEA